MAIRHLLWGCPTCGVIGGVRAGDRGDHCTRCGTRYVRARGSLIRAVRDDEPDVVLDASEWVDRLGDLDQLRVGPSELATEPVELREAAPPRALHGTDRALIGWVEDFGPPSRRSITLRDKLRFDADTDSPLDIRIVDITAIQASSSALLIKPRKRPALSIRFLEASLRLWEHAIRQRIREAFRAAGYGEIREFHPRISAG